MVGRTMFSDQRILAYLSIALLVVLMLFFLVLRRMRATARRRFRRSGYMGRLPWWARL